MSVCRTSYRRGLLRGKLLQRKSGYWHDTETCGVGQPDLCFRTLMSQRKARSGNLSFGASRSVGSMRIIIS
jgi:hypothetical protein